MYYRDRHLLPSQFPLINEENVTLAFQTVSTQMLTEYNAKEYTLQLALHCIFL